MRIFLNTLTLFIMAGALLASRPQRTILAANSEANAPAPVDIKIDNFSFAPFKLTVPAGSQVTWTNRDDIPHNVTSDDKSFKSKTLDTDENFSFTFSKPGTYSYFCSIHPKMTGTIVVQ